MLAAVAPAVRQVFQCPRAVKHRRVVVHSKPSVASALPSDLQLHEQIRHLRTQRIAIS